MSLPLLGLLDLFEQVEPAFGKVPAGADPVACGREVLQTLRRLAATRPVVLAIDDVQWLDSFTARALRYALRRLESEPIGVLATARGVPEERSARDGEQPVGGSLRGARPRPAQPGRPAPAPRGHGRRDLAADPAPDPRGLRRQSALRARARAGARPGDRPRTATPRIALPESLQAAIAERLEESHRARPAARDRLRGRPQHRHRAARDASLARSRPPARRRRAPRAPRRRGGLRGALLASDREVGRLRPAEPARPPLPACPAGRKHGRPREQARHLALSTDEPDAQVAALLETLRSTRAATARSTSRPTSPGTRAPHVRRPTRTRSSAGR